MYKLLLCWRYLRTRYLALVCIVSVMLGVATLIVVNSVMGGFSTKLRDRLHGLLSDVVVETEDMSGFRDPQAKMDKIRNDPIVGDRIEAMAATMEVFAMMQPARNQRYARPVRVIGIEPESRAKIGGFQEFLLNPRGREDATRAFELDDKAMKRWLENQENDWGWHVEGEGFNPLPAASSSDVPPLPEGLPIPVPDPARIRPAPAPPQRTPRITHSCILGYAIGNYRRADGTEERTVEAGDEIILTTVSGAKFKPVWDRFVVSDYIKTEMSEYDSNYIFVPLDQLQSLRTMENHVSSIQIKLKDYADAPMVVERLEKLFGSSNLRVMSWEEKQGPLLEAIRIEKGILNVLLFLIIAVAGFGILAIFSMIVVEKTRDIGILKALGASNGGVMKIFLSYGLLLGMVGSGVGTLLGVTISNNINAIESFIAKMTGQQVFNRGVYYFDRIPVDIQPWSVISVNLGAIAIAVLFSILPALRAAMLHPVRALRFE